MMKLEAQKTLKAILAFGADGDDDDDDDQNDRPKPGDRRRTRIRSSRRDEGEEDEDEDGSFHRGGKFGHISNEKDRRIAELTDESAKRRIANRDLREENEELRAELKRANKIQPKLDDLQKKYDDLEKNSKISAIRNAISNGDVKYHDSEMVLNLLDQEELAVDLSDGSIGGLKEQLEKIATDRPFLVKENGEDSNKKTDDKTSGNGDSSKQHPSGYTPQSSASGAREQQVAEKELQNRMAADFPALANVL